MVFPIVIYICELDHKEGWAPKIWCFQTMVLEKTLENPLDIKEIKPVSLKRNQPWILMLKLKLQSFGHLMRRANSLEKRTLFTCSGTKSQPKRREKLLGELMIFLAQTSTFPRCCSSRNLIYLLITNQKTPLRPGIAPHLEPQSVAPGPLCRMWVLFPQPDPLQSVGFHHAHFCCKLCFYFPPASPCGWGLSPQDRRVIWLQHFLHLPPSFPPSLRSWVSSKRKFPSDSVNWCKRRAVLIGICLLLCLSQLWPKFKSSFLSSLCVLDPPKKQRSRSQWKCLVLLHPGNMSIWGKVQEKACFLLLSLLLHRMLCRF